MENVLNNFLFPFFPSIIKIITVGKIINHGESPHVKRVIAVKVARGLITITMDRAKIGSKASRGTTGGPGKKEEELEGTGKSGTRRHY